MRHCVLLKVQVIACRLGRCQRFAGLYQTQTCLPGSLTNAAHKYYWCGAATPSLQAVVQLISECTYPAPQQRPTAAQVLHRLRGAAMQDGLMD